MTGDPRNGADGRSDDALDEPENRAERRRLVDAFTKLGSEWGYESLTASDVATAAGLPEAVFYEHFTGLRQCLGAAYDAFVERLLEETTRAIAEADEWPLQVKNAVVAGLAFVNETASSSRFFAVDALAAGPVTLERYMASMAGISGILRSGRKQIPEAARLPDLLEPILIGGLSTLVTGLLLAEEQDALLDLEAQIVEIVLTPYLGRQEAQRVAA